MKSLLAAPAAAMLLLASSAPLFAGELPFNAPSTNLAQQNAELLHRAARALHDSAADASRIFDLWLFPTADADTVFAQYQLRPSRQSASSTGHLAVLTVRGDRIFRMRELTASAAGPRGDESASLDWTAMIGTGGTTEPVSLSAGASPASSGALTSSAVPDWTSKIGRGSAADWNSGSKTPAKAAAIVARAGAVDATCVRQ